ncbi:hypothetical protein DQ04_15911010 [Trypanosoma grayi]|uniref:hypothetical protein n=1 Tax=Trypanosoma grayi TaxID=71804 RepID=UPI0004F47F3E|nr:hypothetical protein DQ04_15911010 [Trypanosoma grayi]KEG06106.1 hypothetical protein DQ04_15911010 [Trypanosoma grayi]
MHSPTRLGTGGGGDDAVAAATPVSSLSAWRVAAELLAAHSSSSNNRNIGSGSPHESPVEGARARERTTEPSHDSPASENKKQQQQRKQEDVSHFDTYSGTSPLQRYMTQTPLSPASSKVLQLASVTIRKRQAELLQREETVLRREAAVRAREGQLAQQEEQLRLTQERLGPKMATDAYRQQLHDVKRELDAREQELTYRIAAQKQERERLAAHSAELDARERELEEEQERLLSDTRVQVERIHNGARAVQTKEAAVAQREEANKQREAELLLQRECLASWESALRQQQRLVDAQKANAAKTIATAHDVSVREERLREAGRRLCEREAALWETAAEKVPQGRAELLTLMTILKSLRGELLACKLSNQETSLV